MDRRSNRANHLHKLAVILYRRNRGDTVIAIAEHFHCSRNYIYMQLTAARANLDVKTSADLMAVSSEDQLAFEFMYDDTRRKKPL